MAENSRHVHGAARVQVAVPGSSSWARLGINSRNADIRIMTGFTDLPSDEYGQGIVPADVQIDGQIAEVTLAMTGWDETVMLQMLAPLKNRTEGTFLPADVGTLMIAATHFGMLYLETSARTGLTAERPWFFPCTYVIPPTTQDVGTRFSTKQMVFRCLRHNPNFTNVLYQRTAPTGVLS